MSNWLEISPGVYAKEIENPTDVVEISQLDIDLAGYQSQLTDIQTRMQKLDAAIIAEPDGDKRQGLIYQYRDLTRQETIYGQQIMELQNLKTELEAL